MLEFKKITFLNEADETGASDAVTNEQGGSLTVQVSGTFTATIKAQGQLGGVWNDLGVVNLSSLEPAESIEAAGLYAIAGVEGCEALRLNVTSYTSGEITATGRLVY